MDKVIVVLKEVDNYSEICMVATDPQIAEEFLASRTDYTPHYREEWEITTHLEAFIYWVSFHLTKNNNEVERISIANMDDSKYEPWSYRVSKGVGGTLSIAVIVKASTPDGAKAVAQSYYPQIVAAGLEPNPKFISLTRDNTKRAILHVLVGSLQEYMLDPCCDTFGRAMDRGYLIVSLNHSAKTGYVTIQRAEPTDPLGYQIIPIWMCPFCGAKIQIHW